MSALPAGWKRLSFVDETEAGRLLVLCRTTPDKYETRSAWIAASGDVTWDAKVDGLGYVVDADGRRLA